MLEFWKVFLFWNGPKPSTEYIWWMKHSNLVYAHWILEKFPVFCDSSLMTIEWEFLDFLFKQKETFFAQRFLKKKNTIIKACTTVYSLYGWFFVCSSSKYFWSIYVSMRTGDWKSAFCSASHRLKNCEFVDEDMLLFKYMRSSNMVFTQSHRILVQIY